MKDDVAVELDRAPSRRERRKAEKAATRRERKLEKARRKAWKRARPRKQPWVAPLLWVRDVRQHAHWLERAFGLRLVAVSEAADGTARIAKLRHRRGAVLLGSPLGAPFEAPAATTCATTYLYVADVDELALRATAAGAKALGPARDEPWGDRCVAFVDPEGHTWLFATHRGDAS